MKAWIILAISIVVVAIHGLVFNKIWSNFANQGPVYITPLEIFNVGKETPPPSADDSHGKLLKFEKVDSFTIDQAMTLSRSFYKPTNQIPLNYGVDRYIMYYTSKDYHDESITILAQVFVPQSTDPETEFPLYVFGHGTTGIDDKCAPSKERPAVSNWGNYIAHMVSFASSGFITVMPDYEGFNDDERIHHYFVSQLEAKVLLDATKATYGFFDQEKLTTKPSQKVFYAGYSEGGHAAFAVKDYHDDYTPDMPISGVMGYGPTTDIANLVKENPPLVPYLVVAYSDLYGTDKINPEQILKANWLPTLKQDTLKCIADINGYYGYDNRRTLTEPFYNAIYNGTFEQDFPEIYQIFEENSSGLEASEIPSLILHGTADPIVTNPSQNSFAREMCANGNNLSYYIYPGVHHYQARQVSAADSIDWMKTIIRGGQTRNDCETGNLNAGETPVQSTPPTESVPVVAPDGGGGGG